MEVPQHKTAQCFENPLIAQRILEQSSWDPMRNLKFRLLNKTFDSEMLRRIRFAHRTIRIETPDAHRNRFEVFGPNQLIEHIDINCHRLHASRVGGYFRFLKETALVKLDELVVVNCWALETKELRAQLHYYIHRELIWDQSLKVLVGMEDICFNGCDRCAMFDVTVHEYGPVQLLILYAKYLQQAYHHPILRISEWVIYAITNRALRRTESREQCMANMRQFISANITCDHLCLTVSESFFFERGIIRQAPMLPCWFVEEMCRVWNVKSLSFEFDPFPRSDGDVPWWILKGYFPDFHFDEPIYDGHETTVRLDYVEVDMKRTRRAFREVIDGSVEASFDFNYMIANIRKVFGTRHVIIKGDYKKREFNEKLLENMLKGCWKEHDRRLEVSISMVISTDNSDYEMGDSFELIDRYFECSVLDGRFEEVTKGFNGDDLVIRKYSGRTFRILDTYSRCVLNLKLFVDSDDLYKVSSEEKMGFLRFFM